ncbi:MAG: autotransporter-associated beta strand repeat-containing protein [Opitutaceae bacterium]|nr:autotransporter-associated beta strand repeat-containing protein [Opitutaceae bacterium]
MKSRLTVAALLLVLVGAAAVLRAQTTVPYANGSTDSNPYSSTGNPLTLLVAAGSATQSGVISGTGDITKSGAGLLTLSGANTYTGGTILAGGILALDHADALGGTDSISFTGGTLRYSSVGTTDYSALIKNSTSAVAIDTNGEHAEFASAWSASNTAGLTKSGGGSLTFSGDLSAFTGPVIVGGGTLAFNGSGPLTFTSLSGTGNLYLGPFALTVGASGTSGAFSGNISGLASLTKTGAGTLTLSGANTYSAGTTLAGGTLAANSAGALGSTGSILFTGGTLQFSSANTTDYSARFSTAAGQQYRFDTNGQRVILAQALTSSGATLTKSGAGTLVLSGANSYSGGTWLTGGTIELAANNVLGSGAVTITDAGLRAAGAPRTLTNALFLSGVFTVGRSTTFSGLTTLNATTTIVASNPDGLANADTTFSGSITGNFGLTLAEGAGANGIGTGYIVLSNANTYTGGTTLRTRVSINSDTALGHASGALTMDGGTLRQTTGIVSDRAITLSAGGGTFDSDGASSLTGTISGAGGLTKSGSGTLTLSGTNTYAGGTRVEAGLLNLDLNDDIGSGGLVLAGGDLNLASSTFLSAPLTLTSDATIHLNGGWSRLTGAIVAATARHLTFTGSGIIDLSDADVSQLAGRVTVEDQLFIGTGFSPAELVLGDGATLNAMEDVTVSSTITGTGAELSLRSNNHALALTGVIAGTFTSGLHIDGGDVTLGGVNTFTGAIDVSGTTLRITNSSSLGSGTDTVELFGSTLQALGNATLTRNFTSAGQGIDTNGYALELTGTIASGALIKNGTGTLTLSGSNQLDYVELNAGTLAISAVANINSVNLTGIRFNGGGLRATDSFLLPSAELIVDGIIEVDAGETLTSRLLYGDGGVIKTGAGILDLGLQPNSYAGGNTVRAGILQTSATASLGAAGADFTLDGGTFRALFDDAGQPTTFALDHRLVIASGGGMIDLAVANTTIGFTSVTGTGNFALTGPGTFLVQNSPDYSGTLTVGGDSTLTFNAITSFGTGVIALDAGSRVTGSATLANAFELTGTARFDAAGVFSGAFTGSGGLTTTNTLTLSGNNTFAGGLTASSGTLTLASSTAAGSGTLVLNGVTVELSGSATNLANAVTLGAATQVRVTAAETAAELSGVLTDGSASYGLTKTGAGSLTLSGSNAYNGGTIVSAGRLILAHDAAAGTGSIRLEAGTTLGFFGTRTLANDLVLAGNGTAQTTLASDMATLGGNISGGFGLTKTGAGTLELNGNNSFSGNLVLVEGTLALGSTDSSGDGKLVLQGGTLVTTGWVTNQVLLSGTVVIAALTEPEFFNTRLTADATLDVAGDLRLSGDVSVQGSTPFILTKTGAGSLTFVASSYDQVGLTHSAGTLYLDRDLSGLAGGLTLAGGSLASHIPVIQVHDPVHLQADTAILGQIDLYFRGATTLEANVALSVAEASSTLHITDSIGDNGDGYSLTKTGPGTLNLGDQAHTFSGGFTLEAGKVIVSQTTAGAFGTGPLTLNGGTLQANSAEVPITNTLTLGGDLNFTGTGTLVFSGATTLAQNITLTTATTLTFDGAIGDDGQAYTLTKDGHGELRLNGANTFTGGLTLNQGLTVLGSAAAAGTGTITFAVGSALEATGTLANAVIFSGSAAFSGGALDLSGSVTLTGNTSLNLTLNPADPALTVSGVIADGTGDFTLTKTGGRALILSGANTWSGGMVIFSGLIRAENDAAFGTGTLTFGGGTITTELADRTFANAVTLAGNVALESAAGRSFTFTGPVSIDAPSVLSGYSSTPTTQITFAGALSGSSSLTINTGSPVKLSADNSAFSGGLVLGSFANVTLGHDHAAGSGLLTLNGGTLTAANGPRTIANPLALGGFVTLNGDGFVFDGNVNVASLTGVFVDTSLTFNGNLSGTETLQLVGPNSVALNGDNSGLTGGVDLMLVQATLGSDTALGTGTINLTGATLIAGGADRTISNAVNLSLGFGTSGTHALTLSGPVVLQPAGFFIPDGPPPPDGVTIDASSPLTISGAISETVPSSVTLVGPATVTFSGTNTYTGATTINAGTLVLAATGSIANSTTINVASGATFNVSAVDHFTLASGQTLSGSGSIVGQLTVGSGAHLAPGNSPGTITFTGGLTLEADAILDFQLGTTSDLILVSGGTLTGPSDGTITVNLSNSGGFTAGTYTLIDATGATLTSIGATSLDLGTTIAGYDFAFTQSGNLFQLVATASAVPEPSTCAALAGLFALTWTAFTRRRRAA